MRHLAAVVVLLLALPGHAVVFDWVTVGDPGNPSDPASGGGGFGPPGPFGAVSYVYQISKHETTNAQYVEFLNAVADADPKGLYNREMATNPLGGITRSGRAGSYRYAAKSGYGNRAVNFVSFYDAMRFVNWIHNGEPTGPQGNATTEDGAYKITQAGMNANDIERKPGAQVFIASEDEWYKAAYYDGAGGYTNWPTPVDDPVDCVPPEFDSGNAANCWPASQAEGERLYDVGAYSLSASHYGTFDQAGSVWEWNEGVWPEKSRGIRGSSFGQDYGTQWNAQARVHWDECAFLGAGCATAEIHEIGFRITRLPAGCSVSSQCDDGDVCTTDVCNSGQCSHPFNSASCNDGVACTSGDVCSAGVCAGADSCPGNGVCDLGTGVCDEPECVVNGDCNDGDVCTTDRCVSGTCSITFNTARCNDGLSCTSGDTCNAGVCSGQDACAIGQVCDPGSNRCEDVPSSSFDWVLIGAPGNPGDPSTGGFGAVAYRFEISRTETTNLQYASFLNAVAAADPNGLYDPAMGSDPVGGITRSGASGSYSYAPKPGQGGQPVTYVNFYDVLRFANWVHNGMPAGAQSNATTEGGAYTITAAGIANNTITRNPGARAFLASEDEWYKAAYYDGAGGYTNWPTAADDPLDCVDPGLDTGNAANCWPAVGTLEDVGAYTLSPSILGTYDQGGNVWEWNEQIASSTDRIIRGGAWDSSFGIRFYAQAQVAFNNCPECEGNNTVGFRIARPAP